MTIEWHNIRSQSKGFEELCAQLGRVELPAGSKFERKGSPDGGVECYAVLADGAEWGWQAKYFFELGDSQFSQIDHSVKTALEKHPRLAKYVVCVPLDLRDPRVKGRQSAKDRWDARVKQWASWADERRMSVEFEYWRSSELLEKLERPEPRGKLLFFFDVHRFDADWFAARLDEAIRAAGPRYTPEIHVDLPIAAKFEAFGRTQRVFDRVKSLALNIRREIGFVEHSLLSPTESNSPAFRAASSKLSSDVKAVLAGLSAVRVIPAGELPFKSLADQVTLAPDAVLRNGGRGTKMQADRLPGALRMDYLLFPVIRTAGTGIPGVFNRTRYTDMREQM